MNTKPCSAAKDFKSASVIAIPNCLIDSLSPNNALVKALLAASAPPSTLVKDAKSTANLFTSVDSFKASSCVNPKPVNKSPVSESNCIEALELKPKLLDNSFDAA